MKKDKYITIKEDWFTRLDEIAMAVEKNGKVDTRVLSMLLGYINSADFIVKNFQHPIILDTKKKKVDSGVSSVGVEWANFNKKIREGANPK